MASDNGGRGAAVAEMATAMTDAAKMAETTATIAYHRDRPDRRKGQEQLRVLMGGRGGRGGRGGGGGSGGFGFRFTRGTAGFAALILIVIWGLASFYSVKPKSSQLSSPRQTQPDRPSGPELCPLAHSYGRSYCGNTRADRGYWRVDFCAFADRADADDGRKHRRHRLSGGLEHLGSGQIFV